MTDGALTFRALRHANLGRLKFWGYDNGIDDWSLSDWAVATAGELGEACNIIKKLNRAHDGLRGNTESEGDLQAALAGELADTIIYLDLLAARAGIDLGDAVIDKFNLVSERLAFPRHVRLAPDEPARPPGGAAA
ncbi:MAG: MazG-like family protein [Proteobacteria bacterium]|nr:MazG-like family protein [Pseudomonadota bacterium]